MARYLCMQPLPFGGRDYAQNEFIEVPEPPSAQQQAEIDALNLARALRHYPAAPAGPAQRRDAAMAPAEPERAERGYKTRAVRAGGRR
jgi:hypothetical protein